MKVIFSIYDDLKNPYYGGGGSIAVHELAKRLSLNHDITVVNSRNPKVHKNEVIDGVSYKRVGIGKFGPKIDQIIFLLIVPFYLLFERYDVWVETFVPPISGSFLQLMTKKPVVGLAFFLNADMMRRKYFLPFDYFERLNLKTYRYIIATSTLLEKQIKNVNARVISRVIPLGLKKEYKGVSVVEKKYILYLGRLDIFNKGLDLLLQIAPEILSRNPEFKLVIAGKGIANQEKRLRTIVEKLNINDKIIFMGAVSEDEKYKLLVECMAYIFPSRYETFGMSVLEALSCGKAAVIFDIPGFNWIPDDCAIKTKPFNIEELKENINLVISSRHKREIIGKKAKKLSSEFNWDKIANEYDNFIRNIIERKYE